MDVVRIQPVSKRVFPDTPTGFPVHHTQIPCYSKNREIGFKSLIKRALSRCKITKIALLNAKTTAFPCKFPVNSTSVTRDWLARNCLHSQDFPKFSG